MNDLVNIKPHKVTSSPLDKIYLLYGEPGTRKTSVAVGDIERTLLLAFEIGFKFIPGVYAINMTSWVNLKQTVRKLEDPDVKKKFKIAAIDTIGLAYKACVAYICAQKGVSDIGDIPYGKGYRMAKDEFERVINKIPQAGYGLVMVAHSDELDDEKNGVSVKVDIDKRPSSVIKGLADFILYSRKEPKDENTDEMTVYAYSETNNPRIEVKKRARFFPKRIEFTYENLSKGLEIAITEQDKFFDTKSDVEPDFEVYQNTQDVNLEELQNEVVALVQQLIETEVREVTEITVRDTLPGVRITKTTKNHIPALFALREKLTNLKEGL